VNRKNWGNQAARDKEIATLEKTRQESLRLKKMKRERDGGMSGKNGKGKIATGGSLALGFP
jgi:hypothetical protein